MHLRAIFIILLAIFNLSAHAYLASFYGDSFLFQSLTSSPQDTTTISLTFQTSSSNGILFLALGDSQSLLIELVNGKLEVRVDLGYGEEILSTAEEQSLNNLIWHDFKVVRSGGNIKLVLNGKDVASGQIILPPYNRGTLNIDFGVFVGGIGGNITLNHGDLPSKFFRGCLLKAKVNGRDLLNPLRSVVNERIVHHVISGCPKIFRASRSEPVTFDASSAYIAFKRWTTHDEGTFECMVKTTGKSGIILYNAGRGRGEFIGLEMVDGVIGASVNKGGGVIALHTTTPINDGGWHSVRFSFSPSYLDIRVDGKRTKAFVEETTPELESAAVGAHQNLDLTGHLYIGGVPGNIISNAVPHSLISLAISEGRGTIGSAFPGCMKNLRINHRRKGSSDFLISNQVSAGCKQPLKFLTKEMLSNREYGFASNTISSLFAAYNLKRAKPLIPMTTSSTATTILTTSTPEFAVPVLNVTTNTLVVPEGGHANVTIERISFEVYGKEKLQIRKELLLVVSVAPLHGYLTLSNECTSDPLFEFTPKDIDNQHLRYCHDGSETSYDRFNFTVVWNLENKNPNDRRKIISHFLGDAEFISTGIALNEARSYTLPITVTAVDDLPQLHIPTEYLYEPIKKALTHLPSSILNASDADSASSEVLYTILGSTKKDEYHVENEENPGTPVTEFTQEDINQGKMVFIHNGDKDNARLVLRVSNPGNLGSDQTSTHSSTAVLRIAAIPLNISVTTKDITIIEKSAFIITNEHLSVTSNAEPGAVDFQCQIRKKPMLGVIEMIVLENSTQHWTESSAFSLIQVNKGYVRYRNKKRTQAKHDIEADDFTFTISGASVESLVQKFNIKIKRVDVTFSAFPVLLTDGVQEKRISGNDLIINISHVHVTNSQIQIRLHKSLHHLDLFYNDNGLLLTKGDSFTLAEAWTGRVAIRVKARYASHAFQEMIPLVAIAKDLYSSKISRLNVTYIPDLDKILLVNKVLEVDEGQEAVINSRFLKASLPPSPVNNKITQFHYNVMQPPAHGVLIISKDDTNVERRETPANVTKFTSLDLERGYLYYRHDDTETVSDYFRFRVAPILAGQLPRTVAKLSAVQFDANFSFAINLVNDQRPIRVVSRHFEIARNSERLLTKDDLWYHDADTDFDDLDLTFTRRGITNADILNATSRRHQKVFKFTQRQIANEEVLVKHGGEDFGRFVFWVRDGKHYATGLFTISASEPYLNIVNISRLMVIKGESTTITSENLWSKTNVKGLHRELVYRVTESPQNGFLYLNDSNSQNGREQKAGFSFTQQDIAEGLLAYEHSGSPVADDVFKFEVSAGRITTHGNLTIKAFLKSYQKPPFVQKNRTVVVQQSEKIQIRKQDLRIVHPDTRATDIVYTISRSPLMGRLEFQSGIDSEEFNSEPLIEFSQSDINHGLVWYAQNDSFRYSKKDFSDGTLLDSFTFDVTNGIMSVSNLQFYFDIIPDILPFRLGNFSVAEGKSKAIIREYLWIEGHHFDDAEVEIRVISQPSNGILESTQKVGVQLASFSYKLAMAEFLYYAHDGSDSLQDSYSLQAFTRDSKKQSKVVTAFVTIIPENDELPVVVNNTGMNVWTNSVTEFSSSVLAVRDLDTSPQDISYRILPPSNGWIALKEDPSTAILNFTQALVNSKKVVFVHKGPNTGGFTFQADDGVNYATKLIFVITARLLILTVKGNKNVEVFPGTSSAISSSCIRSSTNDPVFPNRSITYIVTSQPKLGKLVRKENPAAVLSNFTQNDIDDAAVVYKQNAELEKWSEVDSFLLTVASAPAENVTGVKIMVNITYDAAPSIGRESPIKANQGCNITEGEKFAITPKVLDASNLFNKLPLHRDRKHYEIIYSVTMLPLHGNLSISTKNITKPNTTFPHSDLNQNKILYTHDHSDSLQDSFQFDVYLIDKRFNARTGRAWIVPGTFFHDVFDITIIPVNDNPPKLLTKGKVLKVVDGFGTPILSTALNAVDPDNSPEEILYSIIRPPTRGQIVFMENQTSPIRKFTQDDINRERVLFIPYPINMTASSEVRDGFYYSFTDGIQRPAYNLFQIKIVSVYLRFTAGILRIPQGSYSARLSEMTLNVSTNGNSTLLEFRVVQPAIFGVVLVKGKKVDTFTYSEFLENQVIFAITRNDSPKNSVNISVSYKQENGIIIILTRSLDILVTPLLMQCTGTTTVSIKSCVLLSNSSCEPASVSATCNGLTQLGLSELNATALLHKTNSMPMYSILLKPKNGDILKVEPPRELLTSRYKRDLGPYSHLLSQVSRFTHEDVAMGFVFLHLQNINVTAASMGDSIKLRLSVEDGSVPPADFTFTYDIVEAEPEDFSSFFEKFMPKSGEETTVMEDMNTTERVFATSPIAEKQPKVVAQPSMRDPTNSIDDGANEPEVIISTSSKNLVSEKPEPTEARTNLSWMIPLSVVLALILVLGIVLFVVLCKNKRRFKKRKYATKREEFTEENRSLTSRDNIEETDSGIPDMRGTPRQVNPMSSESLRSPACPGVTVTLLKRETQAEVPSSVQPSLFCGDDRNSISVVDSNVVGHSFSHDNPSTIYTPSTVFHYDDTGSMDFADVPEHEFYAANPGNYPAERLYHARSAKFIDPDVLALYSSDESIPSMIDEKYAIPYRGIDAVTGSMPSGLHKTTNQPKEPNSGITSSRSAASLSAVTPQLSLLPHSDLDSNQYWI